MSPLKWFQQDLCRPGGWISALISSSPIAAPSSAALHPINLHAGRKLSLTSLNATQIQWRMCLISRYRSSPELTNTAQQQHYMHPQPNHLSPNTHAACLDLLLFHLQHLHAPATFACYHSYHTCAAAYYILLHWLPGQPGMTCGFSLNWRRKA